MLMPWTRLHAVKDYLRMLLFVEKFSGLKLNFDITPSLADTLDDYSKGANDIHSKITLTPVDELTDDDKEFILNYFFDVDYNNVITKYPRYVELYGKRFAKERFDIKDFTKEEYGDIMLLFNLANFDESFFDVYPELYLLKNTERNFSDEHRRIVIELQRKIISEIIPTVRKYIRQNKIELTVSPYYHPILPLVNNAACAKKTAGKREMPRIDIKMPECTVFQIKEGIKKTEKIFGVKPSGMWLPEQAIDESILEYITDAGIKWAVSDEGVLAASLKKEFVRDFNGYPEDPLNLCETYKFECKNGKSADLIFRESYIPNLIGTEYAGGNGKASAADLYGRLKVVAEKLQNSPHKHHLVTIATDGENIFSNYPDGGNEFLSELYRLITEDKTLTTVLVSDYIQKVDYKGIIKHIEPGSGVNRNFCFWIAEPIKNLAWEYVYKAYLHIKKSKLSPKDLYSAMKKLCTVQGSDWFWWFGEPNDSGNDGLFDYLFREHLKSIYEMTDSEIPDYLEEPLSSGSFKPSRTPVGYIFPSLTGKKSAENEWKNAGCIDIPDSPILSERRLFSKMCFGCDFDNLYLLFDTNNYVKEFGTKNDRIFNLYVYFKNGFAKEFSPCRTLTGSKNISALLKNEYSHELMMTFHKGKLLQIFFSTASGNKLWSLALTNGIKCVFDETAEIKIPFDDLNITPGERIDFFVVAASCTKADNIYPQDFPISVGRPFPSSDNCFDI